MSNSILNPLNINYKLYFSKTIQILNLQIDNWISNNEIFHKFFRLFFHKFFVMIAFVISKPSIFL
jgi:hypothetical protein